MYEYRDDNRRRYGPSNFAEKVQRASALVYTHVYRAWDFTRIIGCTREMYPHGKHGDK